MYEISSHTFLEIHFEILLFHNVFLLDKIFVSTQFSDGSIQ